MMETRRTIHIIEDDDSVREGLTLVVEGEGMTVCAYPDGYSFLARAEIGLDDIVVLDLQLPDISGVSISEHLKTAHAGVAIIVISGLKGISFQRAVERIQPTCSLRKPIEAQALLKHLQSVGHA